MGYFKADACKPLRKLYRIATRGPVDRQLGSEIKYVVCARRKLYGNIFGQGFDSPHLHQDFCDLVVVLYTVEKLKLTRQWMSCELF